MSKKGLSVNFDEDDFINGAGSGEVVKRSSRQKLEKQRIQAKILESDESVYQPNQPKNGRSKSVCYKNNLTSSERKEFYVGTAINVPMYIEDFRLIKEAFDNYNDTEATTLTDYIREVLKSKAEAVLPNKIYTEISNEKLNMVSVKKTEE